MSGAAAAAACAARAACFHCGLPVAPEAGFEVEVDGQPRPMCCPGCAAVCAAILEAGLGEYYRFRTATTGRAADPLPDELIRSGVYDLPAVQERFVSEVEGGRAASLALSGLSCAACGWLIERQLRRVPGVAAAEVNAATQRAVVRFDPRATRVSDLLGAVRAVGYDAHPYDADRHEGALDEERRQRLRDLGLAGVLATQIMMLALAGYLGAGAGEQGVAALLQWASLVLAVPVVGVCARPFLRGALRDLRARGAGMDLPVSLAILIAFAGSVHATVTGDGHVYYDSLAMFTFLLLLARYGEFVARRRAVTTLTASLQSLPAFARRLDGQGVETMVPVATLGRGDLALVRPGETLPADGVVERGRSSVDESLLTGESRPRRRSPGERLVGGSVNVESPLVMRVTEVGERTVLCGLLRLAERARDARPRSARLADRVAAVFVLALLAVTLVVAALWWQMDAARVLPVTVALLVATCPCALSLATPTALTAGAGGLARLGLVPTRAEAVERLAAVDHVVLDKTGTLTEGRPRLVAVEVLGEFDEARCLALCAALERLSEHPLAAAVVATAVARELPRLRAEAVTNEPGAGITADCEGLRLWLGSCGWVSRESDARPDEARLAVATSGGRSVSLLAARGQPLALLAFEDGCREGARELVAALAGQGVAVTLASGDGADAVRSLAERLGIADWRAGLEPAQKLELVRALQASGRSVCMVGDGVNDAPVLAGADVSVAMQCGADASRARADAVLLAARLGALSDGLRLARRTRRVMRENVAWALCYNGAVLPLAALGWLAPWMAALGMSASSLVVVGNALRARRLPGSR